MLFQNAPFGTLHHVFIVSLPCGISESKVVSASVNNQVSSVLSTVQEQIKNLHSSVLSQTEQEQVRLLLLRFHTVFSEYEGDLGCTRLLSHDIPLTDSVPVR